MAASIASLLVTIGVYVLLSFLWPSGDDQAERTIVAVIGIIGGWSLGYRCGWLDRRSKETK